MGVKQAWLNLPVKNLEVSRKFFSDIGFRSNPMHDNNPNAGSFYIGEKDFVLMLFPEQTFATIVHNAVADTAKGHEMLINIDAESRQEVDVFAETVRKAGGKIFAEPGEADGWMYVVGFEDPDGHRWAMLHMDMSKMPGQ
ncbi:extradiol dioxygenase [Dyadobacter luteus]|jgi:predicted lactoylglutathione lyase|uniref:Extradiol dioxygenase n=1 Tax=Dyadobacter luteus TaxID=2259619 RepID=A0A3D8YGC7_9BACT|nr:VOC family protein [Dyadobacter luteus]REA63693.1 extradiol dioxygenase [Dyadobacter luteus]